MPHSPDVGDPSSSAVGTTASPPIGILRRLLCHPLTAWLFLALSLALTWWAWSLSDRFMRQKTLDRFVFRTESVTTAIRDRMDSYVAILRGGGGLFTSLGEVDREVWRNYVASLQLDRAFPGIQGMGFSRILTPAELPGHLAQVRGEGFPAYAVRPPGERAVYSSIIYLEPFDWRNQRAFGYDMYSEPVRRRAMDQAWESGQPSISARVTLVQETEQDRQYGVLVYLPVYRRGLPTSTPAERREAILGFVYAPFRMQNLMHGILGEGVEDVHLHIYDGGAVDPGRILVDGIPSSMRASAPPSRLERIVPFPVLGGHQWTLAFHAAESFVTPAEAGQPLIVACGGLLIDLLLFAIIADMARREQRARRMASRMAEELVRSDDRLAHALEAVGDGAWDWDVAGNTVHFSTQWKAMLGYAPHEVGNGLEEWSSRVHPDDLAQTMADVEVHLAGGTPTYRNEHRMRHKSGRWLWILDRGRAISRDAAGKALRVIGTHTDVTAQHQAFAALDRSEQMLRQLISHAPMGILVLDAEGGIMQANLAAGRILGLPIGPLPGASINGLGFWRESRLPADAEATLADGAMRQGESLIVLEGAPRRWLVHYLLRLEGPRLLLMFDDITQRKQAEEDELIQTDKMAALGTLVAGVGHEINNPANFISLNAPLLKGFWNDAEPVLEAYAATDPALRIGRLPWARAKAVVPRLFQGLEDGIARIRRIVGDLRDFARPDPGGDQPQDLNRIVSAAVSITRHVINRSTSRFACRQQDGLPQVAGSFQRLEQVVVNLLLNACQALPANDRGVTVTTAFDAERGMLALTVADEGVGIPAENLPRIGQPFFTTKRDHGGTGLGLSISRRIIQDHGGEIAFASTVGAGTTVTVLLPPVPQDPPHV